MSYATLALLFLIPPVLVTLAAAVVRRPGRRWWAALAGTVAALLTLTLVFDTLMIAVDLFRYEDSQLSGVMVGLVPIEDLAWPVAAGLLLPSLWLLLSTKEER